MIIRKAKQGDVESMIDVIQASLLATHVELYPKEDLEETFNNYTFDKVSTYINRADYFVAEEKGKIIGCVLLKDNKMRSLYVCPEYMGKGIGKRLVERVEKCAKEKGLKYIWLWSSLVSFDFYKHMGYEYIKDIENDDGLVLHYEMRKDSL